MNSGTSTHIRVCEEGFTPADRAEAQSPQYMIYHTPSDVVSIANALRSAYPHIKFSLAADCIDITVPVGMATMMDTFLRRQFAAVQ